MPVPRSKRIFDVLVAFPALLCMAPILLGLAGAVWLRMGSPVLFRQTRTGLGGRLFVLFKFRTMHQGPGNDADRLDAFGRWLRATSLDELPELWNVLRGDMSLVGPRPLLPEYLPLYSPEQARRHEVLPGLTGWAQVNGRNSISWEEKFRLDVWYVDHRSFGLDLRILALTLLQLSRPHEVTQAGFATSEPFRGNSSPSS